MNLRIFKVKLIVINVHILECYNLFRSIHFLVDIIFPFPARNKIIKKRAYNTSNNSLSIWLNQFRRDDEAS